MGFNPGGNTKQLLSSGKRKPVIPAQSGIRQVHDWENRCSGQTHVSAPFPPTAEAMGYALLAPNKFGG